MGISDFQKNGESRVEGREKLDQSLKEALGAHNDYVMKEVGDKYGHGYGVGQSPFITLGLHRTSDASNKLELGTWSERLTELHTEVQESQSFQAVDEKVAGIKRWWDMCGEYMDAHSSPLGETAISILAKQSEIGVFPEGMSDDWSLDVQSAQTLNFLAALKGSSDSPEEKVAWDLGTLTGISAAVLGSHFDRVVTVERNEHLATFAEKQLQKNVHVECSEIDTWLSEQAAAGKQADMIFMDLDKTNYAPFYKLIMEKNLLKPNGVLVADNVLYRGLPAEVAAGDDLDAKYVSKNLISEKTKLNAQALDQFNNMIKDDVASGRVRSLMMPVRDGMMAVMRI